MIRALSPPPETYVLPPARSIYLPGDGDAAFLLIHGFTGTTYDLRYLAEEVHRLGMTVSAPRLPGHGTNGDDFLSTDDHDWLRRAADEYFALAAEYRRVFVGGLSIGGLIASLLAARYPVAGLILYAPAFKITDWRVSLTPVIGCLVPRLKRDRDIENDDPDLRQIEEEYLAYQWIRPAGYLHRLRVRARRRLNRITYQTLLVVSTADRTVPLSVKKTISRRLTGPLDLLELSTSGHVVTNEQERERVAAESVDWLKRELLRGNSHGN